MELLTNPNFWATLASIATVLGFAVVIWAAFVALAQLKEMTRSRHLEAMLQLYEMIGSDQARADRRYIYSKLKSSPENLSSEEWDYVEKVSVIFDRIGNLANHGLVPKDEFFESHCEIIIRSWTKLEPYIRYRRRLYGGRFANQFEQLANNASKYHSKHFPDNSLDIIDHSANEPVLSQADNQHDRESANVKKLIVKPVEKKRRSQRTDRTPS
ncbi:MAG: DUF4760 domain-containing protein [Caldilineaceae bacterium]